MRDDADLDIACLAEYLAGEAPPEIRSQVEQWASTDPERQRWLRECARALALTDVQPLRPLNVDTLVATVAERTFAAPSPSRLRGALGSSSPRLGHTWRRLAWSAGGVAVTVGFVMLGILWSGSHSSRNHPLASDQQYTTRAGQRSTVRLPDGSTMMLAPATSVSMTARGLTVTGEAYFTVAQQSDRPFIVWTQNAAVRVLGTRFSVRQYPDETHSRIVVQDGRVMARTQSATSQSAVLSQRTIAVVGDSGVNVTSGIAVEDYLGWTRGVLVFNSVPLGDAARELSRAYGAAIRISDPSLSRRAVLMDVPVADLPLPRVLDAIGKVLDAHYTRDGDAYVISPGRRVPTTPASGAPRQQSLQPERQYGR